MLYRLSGLGMRLWWFDGDKLFPVGARRSGATLFNFFIRRRTRSQRCIEEIIYFRLLSWPIPYRSLWSPFSSMSQEELRHEVAEALTFWSVKRQRRIKSLAPFDTLEKYSVGKLKSHPRMLVFVSSSESSKNGDFPLFKKFKIQWTNFNSCSYEKRQRI